MVALLPKKLLPKRFFEGDTSERQRNIWHHLWVMVFVSALVFYALNLSGFAAETADVHAASLLWMTVAAMPGILLLDRALAMAWGMLVVVLNGAWWWWAQRGGVDVAYHVTSGDVMWRLINIVVITGLALYVVFIAERLHRHQLEDIEQSNAALEATHQALVHAQAHKVEFLASVGHELRTPMNAILGLNGLLRSELAADAADVEIVDHIRRSTEQLLQLVNDVLDFSQLQAGQLKLQETAFDLPDLLQTVLAPFDPQAREKGIALVLDFQAPDRVWVTGDAQRLKQVLFNLLANALKFTAAGQIRLCVRPAPSGLLFEVHDTGIGIAPDKQQHIFHGFESADVQTNRQYGGTGLGLAICQRLVALQGGTMGLRSTPGAGAVFWFRLPLAAAAVQVAEAAAKAARGQTHQNLKFLLVDDNAVNLIVARMLLQKCFPLAEVVDVSTGASALDQLRAQSFDVVLMDVIMPEMDGMQTTQALRQDLATPACLTPVIALTASANPVDHARCLQAGMNAVVLKPLDAKDLTTQISQVLATPMSRSPA
jgi:signal transduction histidine kinase/ActR/RegA family two-component response regulator